MVRQHSGPASIATTTTTTDLARSLHRGFLLPLIRAGHAPRSEILCRISGIWGGSGVFPIEQAGPKHVPPRSATAGDLRSSTRLPRKREQVISRHSRQGRGGRHRCEPTSTTTSTRTISGSDQRFGSRGAGARDLVSVRVAGRDIIGREGQKSRGVNADNYARICRRKSMQAHKFSG